MAQLAEDWIATICNEFIGKDEWPSNSPYVDPLDYHVWGVMLEHYKTFYPKPMYTDRLKKVLQFISGQLLRDLINKAILSFTKSLCQRWDGHMECALRKTVQ